LPQTPPPDDSPKIDVSREPLFDDDVQKLLSRSVATILKHVGFDGATEEALEGVCSQVSTYAAHLLSQVTTSMLNSRRPQPTPLDFAHALKKFDLPFASLEPHLKPPVSVSRLRLEQDPLPVQGIDPKYLGKLLGDELSGESDRVAKTYIPKNFPSFPSKHTYKWTERVSERVTDPRKIREEVAKNARQGEEALRRLVKVSRAGQDKDIRRAASKDPKTKERLELWENAMESMTKGRRPSGEDEDRYMIVNSDKQYWRKGAPKRRAPPGPPPGDTIVLEGP